MAKIFPLDSKGFNPFGDLIGLKFIHCNEGTSQCELDVDKKLFNPQHVLHGGVAFSMADTGMGAALYSLLDETQLCATKDIKMTFLKPVTSGVLQCITKVIYKNDSLAHLESEIKKEDQVIARAEGTFAIFLKTSH